MHFDVHIGTIQPPLLQLTAFSSANRCVPVLDQDIAEYILLLSTLLTHNMYPGLACVFYGRFRADSEYRIFLERYYIGQLNRGMKRKETRSLIV